MSRRIPDKVADRKGYKRYHEMKHLREDLADKVEHLAMFMESEEDPARLGHFQEAYEHAKVMLAAFERGWQHTP